MLTRIDGHPTKSRFRIYSISLDFLYISPKSAHIGDDDDGGGDMRVEISRKEEREKERRRAMPRSKH